MSKSQAGAAAAAKRKSNPISAFWVAASSSGTVFEWYDFFIFGLMATTIAKHFFTGSMTPPL